MNSTWRKLVEASEERPLMLTLAQRNAIAEADAHMGRLEAQMALVNTDRALTKRTHAAELAALRDEVARLRAACQAAWAWIDDLYEWEHEGRQEYHKREIVDMLRVALEVTK